MTAATSSPSLLTSLWRRKIGVRLVAVLFGVSALIGAFASYYDYRVEERRARANLLQHARSLARTAAMACADAVIVADQTMLEAYVQEMTSSLRDIVFARVERNSDGANLASSPRDLAPGPDEETLLLTEPVRVGGDELARFVLGVSMVPTLEALQARSTRLLLRSMAGFLLVAAVLWLVLRHVVVKPLRRLDAHASRLARGGLDAPIPSFGESELGRLAGTLEEMRVNLRSSHQSLSRQNHELLQLHRLKSEFLANMSHEIRTPLSSILGAVDFLADETTSAQQREQWIALLRRNGEHLLELVNMILDLSKIESGSLLIESRTCRADRELDEVLGRLRPVAEQKRLELQVEVDESARRPVRTDPLRLRQVLSNVIGNAIKFTFQGRVEVRVRLRDRGLRQKLEIVVADTGVGMPAEFLQRVFEPFSQADGSLTRRFGGTGLGLSISRQVARALGGDITVVSRQGEGTTITVTIAVPEEETAGEKPVVGAAAGGAGAAPGAGSPAGAPAGGPAGGPAAAARFAGRVLIVDDALDNQRLLKAMLGRAGVSTELADNGLEAIEKVTRADEAGFDLVLMDLQMPELDGVSAIRRLRELGCKVPIVALTAHALAEDRGRCLEAGSDAYETKPISRGRLMEILAQYLPAAS